MAEAYDRRELILSTAAEMFAARGLRATTVRQIADAVGVFSGSLYHHFPSQDAILDEVLRRYLEEIRARYAVVLASGKRPAACLHDLVVTSLTVAEEQPHATAIYQNEAQYLRETPGFDDIQAAVLGRLIRDALWLSVRWHRPEGPYSTRQLAEDVTSLFLSGFAAPG